MRFCFDRQYKIMFQPESGFFVLVSYLIIFSPGYGRPDHCQNFTNRWQNRSLKSTLDLGALIFCATRRCPLDYDNYGCLCGLGGVGPPVDEIDRCCKIHDDCYDEALRGSCSFRGEPYFLPYLWWCKRNAQYRHGHVATCWHFQPLGRCAAKLCKCDATVANCFANQVYPPEGKPSCPHRKQVLQKAAD